MAGPDARKIVDIAASEGRRGLERWFKDELPTFKADPTSAESLYWLTKEKSPGAAFLLALLLRASKLLLPNVDNDLELARRENPGLWVMGVAHILSPQILARAREALEKADVLCGEQLHFGGGGSPTPVVFSSYSAFEEHLRLTRAGDRFMLVSVKQLASQDTLLDPTSNSVKGWLKLNPSDEVFLLVTKTQPPKVEIIWQGRESEEDVDCLFQPSEGLFAVPFTSKQDFFIDAKMPNEKGAIPLGGSY